MLCAAAHSCEAWRVSGVRIHKWTGGDFWVSLCHWRWTAAAKCCGRPWRRWRRDHMDIHGTNHTEYGLTRRLPLSAWSFFAPRHCLHYIRAQTRRFDSSLHSTSSNCKSLTRPRPTDRSIPTTALASDPKQRVRSGSHRGKYNVRAGCERQALYYRSKELNVHGRFFAPVFRIPCYFIHPPAR